MPCVGRCRIYESRPQFCSDYPQAHHVLPSGCTYNFVGNERHGECHPEICLENNCCAWPREGGEPEGTSLDSYAGGLPCKHLVWVEEEDQEKIAEDEAPSITCALYEALMPSLVGKPDVQ